jgi:hypothetical protein
MLTRLKQLFHRSERYFKFEPNVDKDEEFAWLNPPADPLDVAAWDRYWTEHIKHGIGPPFFDMFCNDQNLIEAMNANGMKTVLCAGNGISQEPRALAQAGFRVMALDKSPKAVEIARNFEFPEQALAHFCDPGLRRTGGQVEFVIGDLLNSASYPGPFDVIIERRTVQLFENVETALNALISRLGQDGILLSHCHDGGWRPPAKPRHYTRSWLERNGWTIWNGGPGRKPPGRVAWIEMSTG